MKQISGGITAAKGFTAGGIHCGIRKNREKKDLALIVSETICSAACVYTQNLVKGAPIYVTRENVANGKARAVICNSGNANTCNADGVDVAKKMCGLCREYTGVDENDVIVASTGVIGQPLDITPIQNGMKKLVSSLGKNSADAAAAIMTTDTALKEVAFEFEAGAKKCVIGGIAKGSGMIHPNMATMLVFITSDVAISPEMLKKALAADIGDSFNMISIDGDTSTNDMVSVLCDGMAGNAEITCEGDDFDSFCRVLSEVTRYLCRSIAKDGEGATKLIECNVSGAVNKQTAKTVAKSVVSSSLFKAAMFGADANWGRVLCAIGYSGAEVDINKIDVSFASSAGNVDVCKNGAGIDFSEETAKTVLTEDEISVNINLNSGSVGATAWGCDLTYDYVKINGDYRT